MKGKRKPDPIAIHSSTRMFDRKKKVDPRAIHDSPRDMKRLFAKKKPGSHAYTQKEIRALQSRAVELYHADHNHAKELGYALLRVRAALKHGDFKTWWQSNDFSQARVSYCLRLAQGKVAAAKEKNRSSFRGPDAELMNKLLEEVKQFCRSCRKPNQPNLADIYGSIARIVGTMCLTAGQLQEWTLINDKNSPLVQNANRSTSKNIAFLLDALFAGSENRLEPCTAPKPVQVAVPKKEPSSVGRPVANVKLTPIEEHDGVLVKRDDLFEIAGVRGGKVRTCWALAQGATGLVTAGSRSSPQANIVAHIAQQLAIPARVHTPTGELSPELIDAKSCGAEIIQHNAGYNNVIISRARADAAARGWCEIPFGMECEEAVKQTRAQVANVPTALKRLVLPVGSGMTLAGVLWGLQDIGLSVPVVGVVVGADPRKHLDRYAPTDWSNRVTLVASGSDYHVPAKETTFGGIGRVDPFYEAKCLKFLERGDLFWIVGIRRTSEEEALENIETAIPKKEPQSAYALAAAAQ